MAVPKVPCFQPMTISAVVGGWVPVQWRTVPVTVTLHRFHVTTGASMIHDST